MTELPHSSTFHVRPATPTDARALTDLRRDLFTELGRTADASRRAAFESAATRSFADGLADGTCHAWLAETETQHAIGSVALLIYPRLPSPDSFAQREGYLLSVYTVPEWRRRGVAAALVTAAIDRSRELGLGRIRLHATTDGRPVYTARGFRPRDDEMELRLEGS